MYETFVIPIYEYKTVDAGRNTIRIKGVALRGDVVSRNNRKYTREALMKATNTWIGKPINVNHDDSKKVGTIKWMDFDEASDSLVYEAEINRQPYVDMIRNRSTEIRGLSIQADYLHAVCVRCGKRFYTEEDWYRHVTEEEFMKDIPTEPHGIVGTAISLVLSPEIPGYEGTTYELAEMARQATLRLLETVIKTKQEQENYVLSRIALDSGRNVAVGKSGVKGLAEQDGAPEAQECPEGEYWSEELQSCVKNEAVAEQEHECGEGEHWDEEQQKCVKNEMQEQEDAGALENDVVAIQSEIDAISKQLYPSSEDSPEKAQLQARLDILYAKKEQLVKAAALTEQEHDCPEGEHWSETEQMCVANAVAEQECGEGEHWSEEEQKCVPNKVAEQEHTCPEGQHWDDTQAKCVANESASEPPPAMEMLSVKLKPFKASETATKLKLGEPFAGYTDFADCVAKNGDKDNPEAYCGQIKKQAETAEQYKRDTEKKLNELVESLNALKTVKDDVSWRKQIAEVNRRISQFSSWVPVKEIREQLTEMQKKLGKDSKTHLAHYRDTAKSIAKVKETVQAIKPYNDKPLREVIVGIKPYDDKELREKIDAVKPYDDAEIIKKIDEITAKTVQLEEALQKQSEDSAKVKEAYEADLAAYKKDLEEYWKPMEQKIKEMEEKKLKETEDINRKVEEITTKVENLTDKRTGDFKVGRSGNEAYEIKPKITEKKSQPDLTYKGGK